MSNPVLDGLNLAMLVVDRDTLEVRWLNAYTRNVLGWARGARLADLLPELNTARLLRRTRAGKSFEALVEANGDGDKRTLVDVRVTTLKDREDVLWVTLVDLTALEERVELYRAYAKAAEADRVKAESRLASIPEQIPEPILAINAQTEITYINPAFKRLQKKLEASSLEVLLPKEHASRVQQVLKKKPHSVTVEHSSGNILLEWTYHGLPDQNVVYMYGRDMTTVRSAQRRLDQSTRLESLGLMAGGIAHDFNNLLGIIEGHVSLLLDDPALPAPLKQNAEGIKVAVERANHITNQIAAFGSHERDEKEHIDLISLITETRRLIHFSLPKTTTLQISISPQSRAHAHIVGERHKLQRVLLNLITNASLALEGQPGIVTVSVRLSEDKRHILLTVEDDGCGMTADVLTHLFEPYFTTRRAGDGSGLGLSVVHGLVRELNGDIRVESVLNEGSSFELRFPRDTQRPPNPRSTIPPRPRPSRPTKKALRIMVVDDEAMLVRIMLRMLKRQGHQVTGFDNPVEALEAFQKNPDDFDVIITDMSMPRMDGTHLALTMLQQCPTKPIFICSGHGARSTLPPGVRAFIAKPINWTNLESLLTEVGRHLIKKSNGA